MKQIRKGTIIQLISLSLIFVMVLSITFIEAGKVSATTIRGKQENYNMEKEPITTRNRTKY